MIKSSIKTTYSFLKLKRSVDKIVRESSNKLGEVAENIFKQRIDSGLEPALSKHTIKSRKRGLGWSGEKVGAPKFGKTPLKQTGRLYNSLKYIKSKQEINIKKYGKFHNDGFTAGGINVPARPFLELEDDNTFKTTGFAVVKNDIKVKLNKAFKK